MKKALIAVGIIAVIVIVAIASVSGAYNDMVEEQTEVEAAFANIDTQLQRRADLIPNLIETVKGAMAHEQDIINSVTEARAKYVGAGNANDKIAAAGELESALARLMVVVENYPEIKTNQNFTALQDELAGTENRIAVSRRDYNEAVGEYNKEIRTFPKNILANMFGFEKMNYFEAADGAEKAPEVSFN